MFLNAHAVKRFFKSLLSWLLAALLLVFVVALGLGAYTVYLLIIS